MLEDLTFKSLGLVNYHETMDLMRSHVKEENFSNEIWLLEHPPIFTLGTAADKKNILKYTTVSGIKGFDGSVKQPKKSTINSIN